MLRHFLLIAQKRMGSIIFYRALVPSDVISKHCSRQNAPSQPILKTCVRAFVRSGLPIIIYTVPQSVCTSLDAMLALNASVNMYMFHGGTSFGLTAGARDDVVELKT